MLKTTLSLTTLLVCITIAVTAQTTRTVERDETFKGRVRQLTQVNLKANKKQPGPAALDTMMKIVIKFDNKGNELEEVEYIINSRSISADKKHVQKFVTTYVPHYNQKGIVDSVIAYQDTLKHVTNYNESGNIQESKVLNLTGKTFYKLTPNNQIERAIYVNRRGDTTYTLKYVYNQRGNLIKAQSFKRGTDLDKSTYNVYKAYDAKGNWTKRTVLSDYKNGTSSPESIQERVYTYYH